MNQQNSKLKQLQRMLICSCILLSLSACDASKQTNQTPSTESTAQTESSAPTPQDQAIAQNTDDSETSDSLNPAEVNYEHQNDGYSETDQPLQEQFEVRVRRDESQYSMTGYVDKLNIISLNDAPTTLTGVSINRGNCGTKGFYDYKNMHYGSVAKVYLACSAEYVREVTLTTNSGLSYTYNF